MKRLFFLFIACSLFNGLSAQYVGSTTTTRIITGNLIFNSSFENEDGSGYPTGEGEVDSLHSWESKIHGTVHSPDWIYNNLGTAFSPAPTPASGKGIVGMAPYELIQQNFRNEDMKNNTYYILSMYIYLYTSTPGGTTTNSSLHCYLAGSDLDYLNNNQCTPGYVTHTPNVKQQIASFDINTTNYPNTNGWTRISKVFRSPPNNSFWDYFVIDLRENNYTNDGLSTSCEDGYIFIDDVSIEEVDQCGRVCSPTLGAIQYSTMPNAMFANGGGFTMLIKNAIGIDFTVFDEWGGEMYNQKAYDPNGLIDTGYPDYYFSWTGQKPDGSLFPQDLYVYQLRLWNCEYDQTYTSTLMYLTSSGYAIQGWDIQIETLNDCCPQYLEVQDKEYFSGLSVEKADVSITAGENFTTAYPVGPVICRNGSDVKYVSAEINILPGFSVESGASYHAILTTHCSDGYVRSGGRNRSDLQTVQVAALSETAFIVQPNPSSNGLFNIKSNVSSEGILSIDLYNSMGQLIKKIDSGFESMELDLGSYNTGIYFLRITLKNTNVPLFKRLVYN